MGLYIYVIELEKVTKEGVIPGLDKNKKNIIASTVGQV